MIDPKDQVAENEQDTAAEANVPGPGTDVSDEEQVSVQESEAAQA